MCWELVLTVRCTWITLQTAIQCREVTYGEAEYYGIDASEHGTQQQCWRAAYELSYYNTKYMD